MPRDLGNLTYDDVRELGEEIRRIEGQVLKLSEQVTQLACLVDIALRGYAGISARVESLESARKWELH